MYRFAIDLKGVLVTTFRIFREPGSVLTCLAVSCIFAVLFVILLIITTIVAVLYGLIDVTHLSVAQSTMIFAVAFAVSSPFHILVSRLLYFFSSPPSRTGYFRGFKLSRHDWIFSSLIGLMFVLLFGVHALVTPEPSTATDGGNWPAIAVYFAIACPLCVFLIAPATVYAAQDPRGATAARRFLKRMFIPLLAGYVLLCGLSSGLAPIIGWALSTAEAGVDLNTGAGFLPFLGVYVFSILLMLIVYVLSFSIFAAGYRYWRETHDT